METARVETSVFGDLMRDRVDLVPGTKGSGKSALYRIFVDFLARALLDSRKVIIAHGVQSQGDSVFLAFKDHFDKLDEDEFVMFWCIYLVSLGNEQFVKQPRFSELLKPCVSEIEAFKRACAQCRIPEIKSQRSLRDVLGWVLAVLKAWRPKLKYRLPKDAGEFECDLFGAVSDGTWQTQTQGDNQLLPRYFSDVKYTLEAILAKANLSLWLMIDRLDEIFPRRSNVETLALRGLLRTMRVFESPRMRVKVFLRDDILDEIVASGDGFTTLTHVTARQSDTLQWSVEQILTMIVKRLFAYAPLQTYLAVDMDKLDANREYQAEAFYKVFPPKVHTGKNQSPTLQWIYNHTADGQGVVTPRDVIDLLTRAKQCQQDEFSSDPLGKSEWVIGSAAIHYGLTELSKKKRSTLLQAEFPHLWPHIRKFLGGKTEYGESSIKEMFGKNWAEVTEDLISIGFLTKSTRPGKSTYRIPFVYRDGLELTQGRKD